ncbi:MAG: hypothetical protein KC656_04710 [Myxococcales bacterium]|nr:hypothetical protein [Myxococcales bacterium]
MMLLLHLLACFRETDDYPVKLYNTGTELDQILPPGDPMGGQIEYVRYSLFGSDLGLGHTLLFADDDRYDGLVFTVGFADFGYPVASGYDRRSSFLVPGARDVSEPLCVTRIDADGYPAVGEYVDVGDHIALTAPDGDVIRMERDPSSHADPVGASTYASWGGVLLPALTDHAYAPDTWRPNSTWALTFPGTLAPPASSIGSVPFPLEGASVTFPPPIRDLTVDGGAVRAPHHGYDDDGVYIGEDARDEVRFDGPWQSPMELAWTPSQAGTPLTVTLRLLGGELDQGDGSVVLGELTCTVPDSGSFAITPADVEMLVAGVDPAFLGGAVLLVTRMVEDTVDVPDVRTHNGLRVSISPVRTRLMDIVVTRLERP